MKSGNLGNDAITAPVLLLVEGQDEEYLIRKMCDQWFGERAAQIDIECAQGKNNFPKRFKALKVRSLGPLKVVGVIADSEENPVATAHSWAALFADVSPVITRPCKVLQLPDARLAGAFESLVLNALTGNPVVQCATTFRDCVIPHLGQRTAAQKDKIAVQAWLSASLGGAYGNVFGAQQKNPDVALLDFDHESFGPIRQFVTELLEFAE
ncbi:MAG: hypothetical protein RJB68_606 [Pseudomonadota bacterium]|jgi:hypothetical protein